MKYRTIVADPPWEYHDSWPMLSTSEKVAAKGYVQATEPWHRKRNPLPYQMLAVADIAAMPISELAEKDSHLYLWTTNRYLRAAFDVMEAWGWKYSQTLVWAKRPMGIAFGGAFSQNAEYVLFGRRGQLAHKTRVDSVWFNWKRTDTHSRKPEAFLDLVEQISPGPYLEMFARRQRLGWDTWGDQALEHVELSA